MRIETFQQIPTKIGLHSNCYNIIQDGMCVQIFLHGFQLCRLTSLGALFSSESKDSDRFCGRLYPLQGRIAPVIDITVQSPSHRLNQDTKNLNWYLISTLRRPRFPPLTINTNSVPPLRSAVPCSIDRNTGWLLYQPFRPA